jgi:hypothetical protein
VSDDFDELLESLELDDESEDEEDEDEDESVDPLLVDDFDLPPRLSVL